ncbi:MAG: ribonuclease H-like domain-containing protein [Methanobacterium paludis]|nr:ribonuclease H-like domain-containing protein [Methanobacterium paludis]
MINIQVTSKKIIMRWYENKELQTKIVPKEILYADKFKKDGIQKKDIYTGESYGIKKGAGYFTPPIPIPFNLYDYYDFKTASKLMYFKDMHPEDPRAVFFDIETTSLEPEKGVITSISWLDSYTGKKYFTVNKGDEKKCIKGFIDYLKENDILSLIGFNSNFFDVPYLEYRTKATGIKFKAKQYISQDVMLIANKLFYFGSLDAIAERLKVERKMEVDNPVKLFREKRFKELIEYNIQDVIVTKEIFEKLDMANFQKALWNMTWFDYDKIGANSHIDNMFYNKRMWEDDLIVTKADLDYKGDFGGGYNFNNVGVYENIFVYDFSSLYPNIMRGLSLSPENYSESDIKYSHVKDSNLIINKSAFKGVSQGVLDKYITELLDMRKEYRKEGKDNEQLACKILANSVYGILSQKTAKFFLGGTHLSATVTWVGRNMLKTVSQYLKKFNIKTVYGKTDSIFLDSPLDIAQTSEIVQKCVDSAWEQITGTANTTLKMDFEGLYEKIWIINKNNYAFVKKGKIYTKGASFKNTKNSKFEQDITFEILDLVLNEGVKYKVDIRKHLLVSMANDIAFQPISYFAIKHKPRKIGGDVKTNKWDEGVAYMKRKHLGEPEYGFYHGACEVIAIPPNPGLEVILFPLNHEPTGGFIISRKWLKSQIEKIMNKLDLEEKSKQISLSAFL